MTVGPKHLVSRVCGTCRHCEDDDGGGYGLCVRIPGVDDAPLRTLIPLDNKAEVAEWYAQNPAFVSDWPAGLLVAPSFGCVLWEAAP